MSCQGNEATVSDKLYASSIHNKLLNVFHFNCYLGVSRDFAPQLLTGIISYVLGVLQNCKFTIHLFNGSNVQQLISFWAMPSGQQILGETASLVDLQTYISQDEHCSTSERKHNRIKQHLEQTSINWEIRKIIRTGLIKK